MTTLDRFVAINLNTETATFHVSTPMARVYGRGGALIASTSDHWLTIPEGGGYRLELHTSQGWQPPTHLDAGIAVAEFGQSNIVRSFGNHGITTRDPHTWQFGADGTISQLSGDGASDLANQMRQDFGCPVALMNCAVGGTSVLRADVGANGQWWDGGPLETRAEAMLAATGLDRFDFAIWGGGEADAKAHQTDTAALHQAYDDVFTWINDTFNPEHLLVQEIGNTLTSINQPYFDLVRMAEDQATSDPGSFASIGAITTDFPNVDGVHFAPPTYVLIADRMASSIHAWYLTH